MRRHSLAKHSLATAQFLAFALLTNFPGLKPVAAFVVPPFVVEYAPLLWLHSIDPFMPSDILTHILHTAPKLGFSDIPNVRPLDLGSLSLLNQYGVDVFLTAEGDVTQGPTWIHGETPDMTGALKNSTACAVILVEHTEIDIDAFYFYFYSYDEGADIEQIVPPLEMLLPDGKPGDHYGNHVGDWVHSMIRFKDGKPTGIYFSQHAFGQACSWDDETCFSKEGDRPIVYSARGSHANYGVAGSHIHDEAFIDITDQGQKWDPIKPAYFYKYDGKARSFVAADPDATPTDWLSFDGQWGDKQYPDSDPRQRTTPYFGFKKFVDGPNGPQFKNLIRKGLLPDNRPKDALLKKLVRWYLPLYGCCLKGYNPWLVIIVVLLLLAGAFALIIFALRRLSASGRRWIASRHERSLKRIIQTGRSEEEEIQLGLLARADIDEEGRYRYPE